jgi:serine/threonine-protein kinase
VARADPVRPEDLVAAAARRDLVGRSVGPFRVLERLGAGGMGVVYAALDAWLGRRVALKVLAPKVAWQADDARIRREVRLLLREARAAAAITHPNVAAIYAAGEADGIAYIAMEYVDGITLRARLQPERGLPVGDALRYARQLASGAAKAHERGVVHGDLKPDNVMIDGDDRIKILDFGLARPAPDPDADLAEPSSQRGGAGGTPAYMAPEQAVEGRVDARTDVFALGALFYEMLTGIAPFPPRGDDRAAWSFAPQRPLGELRPDAPAAMRAIVERCLLCDPVARYTSAGEVLRRMDATLGGPPSTPRYAR